MITLVQNIQLRFYKNSEDLRMFREQVEIGLCGACKEQVCSPPIRSDHGSLFCLHQSHTIMKITDHCEKSP